MYNLIWSYQKLSNTHRYSNFFIIRRRGILDSFIIFQFSYEMH